MRDDTEQLVRDPLKLKVHSNSGEKPDFECQIYNHLPNQEEHKDHILEVNLSCIKHLSWWCSPAY